MRWISLGLGLALSPVHLFFEFQTRYPAVDALADKLADPLICVVVWGWLLAVLGFGMKHFNFNTPFLKYANEAVLPFYILHQSVIVCLGYFVLQWAIPELLKFLIILSGSFLVSISIYEYLIRRHNILRILFRMKPLPKAKTVPAVEIQAVTQ